MLDVADDDVGNVDADEDFESGVRQNAIDYQAHDKDGDHKLDFDEFSALVREREMGDHTEEELRERFVALDSDGSGLVDLHEYVRFSLRDAITRSSSRVIDLFRQWDSDGSGEVDKKEFRMAIKALGFNFFADDSEIDMVFNEFDTDGSGSLDYRELNKQLRQGAGSALDPLLQPGAAGEIGTKSSNKRQLRRHAAGEKGKATISALKGSIDASSDKSVQDQLRDLLSTNAVRVIDLFREWDDDGNGLVSKAEFRKAMVAMGIQASSDDINAVFDTFDNDLSGSIEYSELNKALRRGGTVTLDPSLAPGAAGAIELKAKNRSNQSGGRTGGYSIGGSAVKPVAFTNKLKSRLTPTEERILEDLHKILARSAPRLDALFRRWDTNGNGAIDRKEWAQAVPMIGIRTTSEMIDMLFNEFDADGDGQIEIDELRSAIRERQKRKPAVLGSAATTAVRNGSSSQPALGRDFPNKGATQPSPAPQRRIRERRLSSEIGLPSKTSTDHRAARAQHEHKPPVQPASPAKRAPQVDEGVESIWDTLDREDEYDEMVQGSSRRQNPFNDMKLALEAAPLGLRVVAMPAVDDWAADDDALSGTACPDSMQVSRVEAALLSELDLAVDALGLDGATSQQLEGAASADEVAAIESRRQAARAEAAAELEMHRQDGAAVSIQAKYRGMRDRRAMAYKGKSRQWRFQKFHTRTLKTSSGRNRATFYIEKHETLEIVAVQGTGRLVLDATTPDGELVVSGGVVYDSSAHALLHPGESTSGQGVSSSATPLWTTPGEFEYVLRAEPLAQGHADMTVTFRVEMLLTGFDVVSEPPLPPIRSIATDNSSATLAKSASSKVSKYIQERFDKEIHVDDVPERRPDSSSVVQPAHASNAEHGGALGGGWTNYHQYQGYSHPSIPPVPSGFMRAIEDNRTRADEIEAAQSRFEASRGIAHLSQLDARSQGQLQKVGSQAQLMMPPQHAVLHPSASFAAIAAPGQLPYQTYQGYPGYPVHMSAGFDTSGWPSEGYYYAQAGAKVGDTGGSGLPSGAAAPGRNAVGLASLPLRRQAGRRRR